MLSAQKKPPTQRAGGLPLKRMFHLHFVPRLAAKMPTVNTATLHQMTSRRQVAAPVTIFRDLATDSPFCHSIGAVITITPPEPHVWTA